MSNTQDELREKLAAIEHERWADWQKYVHGLMTDEIVDGKPVFTLPVANVVRWQAQIKTPYSKLSEKEKASDMEQVDRYWSLIEAYKDNAVLEARIDENAKSCWRCGRWHEPITTHMQPCPKPSSTISLRERGVWLETERIKLAKDKERL